MLAILGSAKLKTLPMRNVPSLGGGALHAALGSEPYTVPASSTACARARFRRRKKTNKMIPTMIRPPTTPPTAPPMTAPFELPPDDSDVGVAVTVNVP